MSGDVRDKMHDKCNFVSNLNQKTLDKGVFSFKNIVFLSVLCWFHLICAFSYRVIFTLKFHENSPITYLPFFSAATAPRNVSATAISVRNIQLTWMEPIFLNGILNEYKVRYKVASDTSYGSSYSAGSRTLFILHGLKPCTDYDFQVSGFLIIWCFVSGLEWYYWWSLSWSLLPTVFSGPPPTPKQLRILFTISTSITFTSIV